jgi:hypothetical protein
MRLGSSPPSCSVLPCTPSITSVMACPPVRSLSCSLSASFFRLFSA